MKNLLLAFLLLFSSPALADDGKALFTQTMSLAEKGNAEAQYHIGMMYHNGLSVDKNPQEAFAWFSKSAEGGFALAHYKLGCYYDGQGAGVVARDKGKTLYHKLKAANAGYSLAQSDVAKIYYDRGNPAEAFTWLIKAAKQGDAGSMYNLSVFFRDGVGTQKNMADAYSYFKLAQLTARGEVNKEAQTTLDELSAKLTPAERTQADAMVAKWKSEPTAITLLALQGIQRAKGLTHDR